MKTTGRKPSMLTLCALAALTAVAATATAGIADSPFKLFGYVELFDWEETSSGITVVHESGPIFGVGILFDTPASDNLRFLADASVFFGGVNYDGHIQTETALIPYSSNSAYVGFRGSALLTLSFDLTDSIGIEPFGGVSGRLWRRELDASLSSTTLGIYGYTEDWTVLCLLVGIRTTVPLNDSTSVFFAIRLDSPFETEVNANLTNVGGPGSVILKPGKQLGIAAEAGVTAGGMGFSLYFEGMTFPESPTNPIFDFFQPESTIATFGFRATFAF